MNDNVDMRHYGGLWRVMPITFVTFGLGYLALIGFPPLVRLTSRRTRSSRRPSPRPGGRAGRWPARHASAGLTAFYMTRLMFMTFFGEKRWQHLAVRRRPRYHPTSPPR
jgi:NADH-quinone oxidoreductase subunit L